MARRRERRSWRWRPARCHLHEPPHPSHTPSFAGLPHGWSAGLGVIRRILGERVGRGWAAGSDSAP